MTELDLRRHANEIRADILKMAHRAKSSHVGAALSIADILTALYFSVMRIDSTNPAFPDRDRLILSKGHACTALYATLAEAGFFPKSELNSYAENGSEFMAHISHKVPGVEFSTGSLGHGLPFASGKALAAKLGKHEWRTFVIVGDGELDEGSNWEAVLFAAHHQLKNLVLIIDVNNLQSLTTTDATLRLHPLSSKFEAFGWITITVDGHDLEALQDTLLDHFPRSSKPIAILAKTVKGKGVSFMENEVKWHYKNPNDEELKDALQELAAVR